MRSKLLAAALATVLMATAHGAAPVPPASDAASSASSAADVPADNPRLAQARQLVDSLHFRNGEIAIPEAHAHVHLNSAFRFLDKADTRKVLEQLWNNPPDDDVLGMIVPGDVPLLDEHAWAVVVTRTDDGHVADEDAQKTDYAKLLKDMQEGIAEHNDERRKAGYAAMQLIGWAEPPRYDAVNKKLYWARELAFGDATQHTLNYDIRVLGRTGYLSLNAVAGMGDLATVRSGMQQILPLVDFDPGQRYADFDPHNDRVAEYGIAALVAGGIAAKAGLFAKLGAILLAAKKLIVALFVAIGAGLKKLFGGKGGGKRGPGPTVQ